MRDYKIGKMKKSRIERIAIYSNCLDREMSILVYLPKDYDENDCFPTLYFHHGRSGDENILTDADLHITADRLIENQQINSLIIVCPNLENSRGLNSSTACKVIRDTMGRVINMGRYEDYFINEVIPVIDNKFKTIKNRNSRFIGGASAGGYTALHNVFSILICFQK